MGALKSGAFPVELNGKKYGLLFSLNALDEVQEKFGGYDKLSEVFNKDNPNLFKDTRWLLTLLINEALLAEDENAQLLEEKRVGRLIHAGNLQEVQNAIFTLTLASAWLSARAASSIPVNPTRRDVAPREAMFIATFAAPPGRSSIFSTFTTGTGASGEIRLVGPYQ